MTLLEFKGKKKVYKNDVYFEISDGLYIRESFYFLYEALNKNLIPESFESIYLKRCFRSFTEGTVKKNHSLVEKLKLWKKKLHINGGAIDYEIQGGEIYIQSFELNDDLEAIKTGNAVERKHVKNPIPGTLYHIQRNTKTIIDEDKLKISHTPKPRTSYIGVSSIDGRKFTDTAELMFKHIKDAYPAFDVFSGSYDLFYNPESNVRRKHRRFGANFDRDNLAFTDGSQIAHKLAALIEDNKNKTINWTVSRQGNAVFYKALQILSKESNTQGEYKKHNVVYSHSHTFGVGVDNLRRKLGMRIDAAAIQSDNLAEKWFSGQFLSSAFLSTRWYNENKTFFKSQGGCDLSIHDQLRSINLSQGNIIDAWHQFIQTNAPIGKAGLYIGTLIKTGLWGQAFMHSLSGKFADIAIGELGGLIMSTGHHKTALILIGASVAYTILEKFINFIVVVYKESDASYDYGDQGSLGSTWNAQYSQKLRKNKSY